MGKDYKIIYVNGWTKEQVQNKLDELRKQYKEVVHSIGHFGGTAEYYGDIYAR